VIGMTNGAGDRPRNNRARCCFRSIRGTILRLRSRSHNRFWNILSSAVLAKARFSEVSEILVGGTGATVERRSAAEPEPLSRSDSRLIFTIADRRFAFEFSSRVTELKHTPARILGVEQRYGQETALG